MAVAACLLGYGEVGLWLKKESLKPNTWVLTEGNPYATWMEEYGGENYQEAVKRGLGECHFLQLVKNERGSECTFPC